MLTFSCQFRNGNIHTSRPLIMGLVRHGRDKDLDEENDVHEGNYLNKKYYPYLRFGDHETIDNLNEFGVLCNEYEELCKQKGIEILMSEFAEPVPRYIKKYKNHTEIYITLAPTTSNDGWSTMWAVMIFKDIRRKNFFGFKKRVNLDDSA